MGLRHTLALLLGLIMALTLGGGIASAAPDNAPNATTFELDCDNGQIYNIVVNGNGAFTPGHIVDGDGMVIPVAFTIIATDEDGNILFSSEFAKPGKMHGLTGDLFDCTFTDSFEGEDGEIITIDGAATVFVAPRN